MARKKEEKKEEAGIVIVKRPRLIKLADQIVAEISKKAIPQTQMNTDFQRSYEAGFRDALKAVASACD